jgi:S-adenosylmethionine:tRNA ribosyltransferase-isomerase
LLTAPTGVRRKPSNEFPAGQVAIQTGNGRVRRRSGKARFPRSRVGEFRPGGGERSLVAHLDRAHVGRVAVEVIVEVRQGLARVMPGTAGAEPQPAAGPLERRHSSRLMDTSMRRKRLVSDIEFSRVETAGHVPDTRAATICVNGQDGYTCPHFQELATAMSELDAYDYHLPRELIAQRPLAERSAARLLVVRRDAQTLEHRFVRDLPDLLAAKDGLVLNDTRVIPARLVGYRTQTRGRWEGLYLGSDEQGVWKILAKTRGKIKPGERVTLQDRQRGDVCRLILLDNMGQGVWAACPEAAEDTLQLLERVGRVPLPPYIRDGEMTDADRVTYQTVYAERPGAVAAPTAGLHFTPPLLQRLEAVEVEICRVTLHVGLGTFRPISAASLDEHPMHAEWASIDAETVARLQAVRAAAGRIIAVGTTVVRTLETAASTGRLQPWQGETDLFIRPPYQFRAVDALLTNFHLPKSTLLILVRTFGGDDLIRRAYNEAIRQGYRFYSYGDAMLIL